MDKKVLTKAVIVGLILHIGIVAFYISGRRPHGKDFIHTEYSNSLDGRLKQATLKSSNGEIIGVPHVEELNKVTDLDHPDFQRDLLRLKNNEIKDSLKTDVQTDSNLQESGEEFIEGDKDSLENVLDDNTDIPKETNKHLLSLSHASSSSPSSFPSSSSLSSSMSSFSNESPNNKGRGVSDNKDNKYSNDKDFHVLVNERKSSFEIKNDEVQVAPKVAPWKTLKDENHPLYDRAFSRHIYIIRCFLCQARNTKPAYLLEWKPSPDSSKYFHKVEGTDAYLYSAYLEQCTPPFVRLIGISPRDRLSLGNVFCHYLDSEHGLLETQRGRMLALKDNHLLNHTAASVDCPISSDLHPKFVIITKGEKLIKTTWPIPVQTHPQKPSRDFTLCFSPLHSFYNYTFQLVQSIELNRLLGATHFVFYNFSTTPRTDEILRYYEKEGLVTVLPWPLPHLQSWYYGQIAAINDCIYRNKMTSRYVVIVDTDEFIVPNKHSNWLDLLHDVTTLTYLRDTLDVKSSYGPKKCTVLDNDAQNSNPNTQLFGSFMFRCSFFADKPLSTMEHRLVNSKGLKPTHQQGEFFKFYRSEPMIYLKRNDEIYQHESRSKLIVRPETVVSHAIHKTVEHVSGYTTAYVNSSAAFLHHYRPYKIKSLNTLDISALNFKDKLYDRLRYVVKKFPSTFDQL